MKILVAQNGRATINPSAILAQRSLFTLLALLIAGSSQAAVDYVSADRMQLSEVRRADISFWCDPPSGTGPTVVSSQDLLEFNPSGIPVTTITPNSICSNNAFSASAVLTHSALAPLGFSGNAAIGATAGEDESGFNG